MAKNNKVLTIDVGGDNLKMAEFSFVPGGGIVLTGFAFRRFDAKNDDGPSFEQVYREMLEENRFTARGVRLSLAAQNSFQRLSKLPPMLGNRSSISRIVEYEARQTVPYSMNEVEWGYQLIHHEWTERAQETAEDGTVEEVEVQRSEYEALFVAMKTEEITRFTDVIEASGKMVLSVDIAPVALFNAAKAAQQVGNDECVLLLNIGGGGSSLMISDRNRAFMRSIPIGGDTITTQIAKEFDISFEEAEELKLRHGFVALGGAYEDPESELAATISKVARTIMTRLHGEVSRSINVWRSQHGGSQPTRMLLAGGGSTMLYVTDFFQEKLRVPVSYLNTFGAISIDAAVDKAQLQPIAPMFQELIGMSLRSVTNCPIDISLLPRSISKQRELNRKKPYLFLSAAGVVLCLGVFAFAVQKLSEFEQKRGERTKSELDKVKQVDSEVSALNSRRNGIKGEFDSARGILSSRNSWTKVLEELQRNTPDGMWYVVVEGITERSGQGENSDLAGGDGLGGDGAAGVPLEGKDRKFDVRSFPLVGRAGVPASRANQSEVKFIRLVGYTVEFNRTNTGRLLNAMSRKLASSEYFKPEPTISINETQKNFSRFELYLELKEPIRK